MQKQCTRHFPARKMVRFCHDHSALMPWTHEMEHNHAMGQHASNACCMQYSEFISRAVVGATLEYELSSIAAIVVA